MDAQDRRIYILVQLFTLRNAQEDNTISIRLEHSMAVSPFGTSDCYKSIWISFSIDLHVYIVKTVIML